ncbi:MAG: DNA-processing protein DprA [Pseudomonadota bacterium]
MTELSASERIDWLQLIRTPTIGPITFRQLLARYGSAAEALRAAPDAAARAGRSKRLRLYDRSVAEEEIDACFQMGVDIVALCEADYPKPLAAISDPPPLLFLRGHRSLFEKPAVAIIGARNASGVGRKIARTLAADLGAADVVVTSGLARGIDGAAHEAAIGTGTIAVVAGGVDVIYPPEHAELTERIANEGVILSEQGLGKQPTARDFPKRNRLISGLSRGVIVVEAASRSGTLITARFALEQGREVFAVPGSPLDPRCQGANRLIREGAALVETAEDVLTVLAEQNRGVNDPARDLFEWADATEEPDPKETIAIRSRVLETLSFTPLHRDIILQETDGPPGLVAEALLDLVLSGEAEEHSGGAYSLAAENASTE